MGMKWVSVKDKLPKDDTSNDEYLIGKYEKVIVAWAELPHPYEGD